MTRRSARKAAPEPDSETYQVGTWSGIPNYGCPFCPFRSLATDHSGTAVVVAHIASDHREQAIAQAQET